MAPRSLTGQAMTVKVKALPTPTSLVTLMSPAHQLDQLAADGQAQARAPEFADKGIVGLGKGPENAAQLFGGDSDARVLDLGGHHHHAVGRGCGVHGRR